jgi:short-subunit dehydrogenase
LRAFTYSLAAELRERDIKIAVISPGPIDTGFILDDIDSVSDLTFSQRISTVENVAKEILILCNNKRIEKTMPWLSGILTNLTYLFPKISQFMLPFMENKGRRNKRKIKNKI